jgi:hypothetical protein
VLDIHPLGVDIPVRAGPRGLGFIDSSETARIIEAMNESVAEVLAEGLLEQTETRGRQVLERFDDPEQALDHLSRWEDLHVPASLERRLRATTERPIEIVNSVRYRLFETR